MRPDGFLGDLELIPQTLGTLAHRLATEDPWAGLPWRPGDRVLLLGMGSSTYAAGVVAQRMRRAGIGAVAELASAGAEGHGWAPADDLTVVAVSAGGSSVETLAAAERFAGGGRLVALTERPDSPLAELADLVVPLGAGPEPGGVACRSFRHTLVLLAALADRISGGPGLLVEHTRGAARAVEALLAGRESWLPALSERLGSPDGVYLLAPADRISSAQQSALMLREGPRRAAVACETGDWAHVDVYLAKTLDYRVLLLPGSRWDAQAMEWLTMRGSTVVPVGAEVPGADPALRYPGDRTGDIRLLAEVTVSELLAWSWWRQAERVAAGSPD